MRTPCSSLVFVPAALPVGDFVHRWTHAETDDRVVAGNPRLACPAPVQKHRRLHFGRDVALGKLRTERNTPIKRARTLRARVKEH